MTTLDNSVKIGNKLEKETSNFSILKDRVEKYHDLTKNMSSILTTFENRLATLEKTILPVYSQTEHLQKRQQNLESTLQGLETVLSHYDASQEVCGLIHEGPNEGNIIPFLQALDRLKVAKNYFLENNSQSVELENVTSLFNTGCESLNNYYKSMLKKHGSALKPVDLLDLIYMDEDSSNEDYNSSIKQITPNTREELRIISFWLEQNLRKEFIEIYSEERSEVVFRSLQNLKDHQKSGSWGNEPMRKQYGRVIETKKTTSARLQHIFEKKASKMLSTIEQSTGLTLKKNSSYSEHLNVEDNYDGDQELDKYLVLLLGLQRLLVWERTLMNDIIPQTKHTEVFSKLAYNSIEMVVKDAEAITNRVIRNIAKKEWTSVLGIFSALKRVIILQPDIDRTCDSHQREQLRKVLNKLQQTGNKALEQFLEVVKGDSGTNLVGMTASSYSSGVPKDATVHELTSNTIWFIENLIEHYDVVGEIFENDVLYASQLDTILMKKNLSREERKKALLAIYIKKVLSELNLTIIAKCEYYSDSATKYLFRLNNIFYILKSLQRSNLMDLVMLASPDCERNYLDIINELKISYQKSWSKLLSNVSLDELPRAINGKVKDKERQILKDRFSNFNKDLEEVCKVQRGISIPDISLREGLKRDNIEHILPKYNQFFETYADVQFSKNPDKYVKYKPHEVHSMLNKLFDDSII